MSLEKEPDNINFLNKLNKSYNLKKKKSANSLTKNVANENMSFAKLSTLKETLKKESAVSISPLKFILTDDYLSKKSPKDSNSKKVDLNVQVKQNQQKNDFSLKGRDNSGSNLYRNQT